LDNIQLSDFGNCELVEVTKGSTTVVDGHGNTDEILKRIEEIKSSIMDTENMKEAERLQERVTRLSSGVAIIKVGASSHVEMIEKKHRIEDALEAVYAAQESGIVPGGGSTLLKISDAIELDSQNPAHTFALQVFKKSLKAPFEQMCINSAISPTETMKSVASSEKENAGFDFRSNETVNLIESGIIDPAKVLHSALRNAVSVAGTLLLTNHAIIEK
jgi:chaperonin GroEL